MAGRDKYFAKDRGALVFRSPLMRLLNPILRCVQFWAQKPWVLVAVTTFDTFDRPHFCYYELARLPRPEGVA